MRGLVLLLAVALPSVALAQADTTTSRAADGAMLHGFVPFCRTGPGLDAAPCGGFGSPMQVLAGPVDWKVPAQTTIVAGNLYQVLFSAGQALHGGFFTNTCSTSADPIWLDVTGTMGIARSVAAMPVYPAASAGSAPGALRFPGTTHAVTVIGPAGCTFSAFGG